VAASDYNYEHFDEYIERGGDSEFAAFRDLVQVGDPAPDFTALHLNDGATIGLSDLWRTAQPRDLRKCMAEIPSDDVE
jgi:hypothetical protein